VRATVTNHDAKRPLRVIVQARARHGGTFDRVVEWYAVPPGQSHEQTIYPGQRLILEQAA
jgi:hypothetical protein